MPDPAENRPPRVPGGGEGAPDTRPVNYTCGFCGCTNTRRGEVLQMSAEARTYRDQQDTIESLRRDLERRAQDISNLQAQLEAAATELAAARRGHAFSFGSGRV